MRPEYSKLFHALEELNVDVNGTVERFVGNDEIYVKFLNEFSETERFPAIYEALGKRDADKLIMLVHKLKGVSGNLGMNDIYTLAEDTLKQIRNNSYDGIEEKLHTMEVMTAKISEAIKANKPR